MNRVDLRNVKFVQTCGACPSQWEAEATDEHPAIYIRYRWGQLSIRAGATINDAVDGEQTLLDVHHGDDMDGVISLDEVLKIYDFASKTAFTRDEVTRIINRVTAEEWEQIKADPRKRVMQRAAKKMAKRLRAENN